MGDVKENHVEVARRVYRGHIHSPKTNRSKRKAAISINTRAVLRQWLEFMPDPKPTAWLFPSENGKTPLLNDNCWQQSIVPRLKEVGLQGEFSGHEREGVSPKCGLTKWAMEYASMSTFTPKPTLNRGWRQSTKWRMQCCEG